MGSNLLPAEDLRVGLSRPHITVAEREAVARAMADGWISGTGPAVADFQSQVAERTGRTYTLAVANGTTALELALRALGVGPGDMVIVPCLTFAAPASSVLAVGAQVVLVDIAEESWTMDPEAVAAQMSPRVKAIIAVDLLGHACDYDTLARFGVPVIQDAAQAHGASYKGQPVGGQGDVSIFSYHANKAITTGEGGSVGTDDAELAQRMGLIMNHGMTSASRYVHEVVGRNYRMTNLSAALGTAQMRRWDELTDARRAVSEHYRAALEPLGGRSRPVAPWTRVSAWLHTITVACREPVVERLRARGIDARPIWPPLHHQPFLAESRAASINYPVACRVSASTLWLPTFSGMTDAELGHVTQVAQQALLDG